MKIFKCEKCEKCFNKKYDYETHIKKKKSCIEELQIVKYKNTTAAENIHCEFCNQQFDSNRDLQRHFNSKNTCLKKRNENKKAYIETLNFYDNRVKNNLEIFNKIKPVKFRSRGRERVDHITKDVVLELFKNKHFIWICEELMKLIYFNEKIPENSTWSIAYPKNDTAGVAYNEDEDEFERKETKEIVEDKFSNMINLLVPVMQSIHKDVEFYETLSDMQQVNMVRFFYHLGMYQISKESPDVYEAMHKLCYDQRKIPMKLWGEQGYSGSHLSLKFG